MCAGFRWEASTVARFELGAVAAKTGGVFAFEVRLVERVLIAVLKGKKKVEQRGTVSLCLSGCVRCFFFLSKAGRGR
jgi:hypothetical protein